MGLAAKILMIAVTLLFPSAISFFLFDHWETSFPVHVSNGLFVLLGVIAMFISFREPTRRGRMVFLNFAVYFLAALASFVFPFVGRTILLNEIYASLYFDQYVIRGLVVFLMSFAILYVVIDSIFSQFSVLRKYLLSLLIVGGTFGYYYHPFFEDARYLYKTQDIEDFRAVDKAVLKLKEAGVESPTPQDVAKLITLNAWNNNRPIGRLFEQDNLERIAFMIPYLEGNNYTMLLMKPLYLNVIYMDVLAIVFIIVFFGYQYKKDPPLGAYTEKIMFLLLPLCTLDILHNFAYVRLQDYQTYIELFRIAHYLVIVNAVLLVVFFSLRLSFITSIKGEFYERELVLDSEHISRWRDGIDSLVVRHFLNPKTVHGRLFAPRESRSTTT